MKIIKTNYEKEKKETVVDGVYRIWLIYENMEAKNFFMRMFEIQPGKSTAPDRHPYEHEIFVVNGNGIVKIENESVRVVAGDALFIAPNKKHSTENIDKNKVLQFLCIVPASYRQYKRIGGKNGTDEKG